MYTENPVKDVSQFAKAVSSNLLARFAPRLYVNLTHQTGRGKEETSLEVSEYFLRCFREYGEQLGFCEDDFSTYLKGKTILEYGPGDVLGVALLLHAHGAQSVMCVDKFPLSSLSNKNIEIYEHLLHSLQGEPRTRADNAFKVKGDPRSGFRSGAIDYRITRNGLAGVDSEYDLIISRAVLEHVNDLEETMRDIQQGLKKDGISLHQVDLKSHGLDRYVDFDFLTWPTPVYRLMYSHKGFPNRWRIDKYRELAQRSNLLVKKLSPTDRLGIEKINSIYNKLAKEFTRISPEDLSWKGFWMILERK